MEVNKIIVFGAGRMGVRHITGCIAVESVKKILIVDINQESIDKAIESLSTAKNHNKCQYILLDNLNTEEKFDLAIVASTANNRRQTLELASKLEVKKILIEKPLGQSLNEVKELIEISENLQLDSYVNLNMRMYDYFKQLKKDFSELQQLKGFQNITMNTGSIGIGANGIHYLDLLYYLLDADDANIQSASIDDVRIESPRGSDFFDFGGWSVIQFLKEGQAIANAFISISSRSTVFGSWEFVGPHGRIYLNEVEQVRIDTLRDSKSSLPMYRYFGDYLKPVQSKIEPPFLGDLTKDWLIELQRGESSLPSLKSSFKVHRLLFDWLGYSTSPFEKYPIT